MKKQSLKSVSRIIRMKLFLFASLAIFAVSCQQDDLLLNPEAEFAAAKVDNSNAAETLSTPLLVVTVRDQKKPSGILYWEGATPSVRTDVLRNGTRIVTVNGSTTGNNLFTDSSRGLKGKVTYKVCYSGTDVCSNSITVNYDIPGRYAPECPTTGTATCIVTLE